MKRYMIGSIAISGIIAVAILNFNLNNENSTKKFSSVQLVNMVALSNESNVVITCGQWESDEHQESNNRYYRTYSCLLNGSLTKCKVGKITYSKGLFGIHYNTDDDTTEYNCPR
jgi:hypothetical protein